MALVLTRGGSGDVVCSNRFEVGGLDEITSRQPMHKPSLQRVVDVGYDRKASRFNHNGRKPQGNDQGHAYHDYMRAYEKLFCGMPRNLSVLNVGVLDGHSLRTYSDFFGPKAHVVGADISLGLFRSQTVGTRPNIKTYEGDQTSRQTRDELHKLTPGGKFDLIIEDGCAHTAVHRTPDLTNSVGSEFRVCSRQCGAAAPSSNLHAAHRILCMPSRCHQPCAEATLRNLWPLLREGGLYVVEDVEPFPPASTLAQTVGAAKDMSARAHDAALLKLVRAQGVPTTAELEFDPLHVESVTFGRRWMAISKYRLY